MNPDLPSSKASVLPVALHSILKQLGAKKLDARTSKPSKKYRDEHSIHPLEAVNAKIPKVTSNRELKIRKRLGLEEATFVLKFFGNEVTLGIWVDNISKASRTYHLK